MYEKVFDFGYVTNEISSNIPITNVNENEENRIKFVTSIAAVCYGKDGSNNPKKRYFSLLKEAAPNICNEDCNNKKVASRALEFLPVVLDLVEDRGIWLLLDKNKNLIEAFTFEDLSNKILHFSYIKKIYPDEYKLFTNMRCLLNAGIKYEKIPYNTNDYNKEYLKYFRVLKIKAPHFVFDQIYTHTQLSKISLSRRYVELKPEEYWLPKDFCNKLREKGKIALINKTECKIEKLVLELLQMSTLEVISLFKELGYKKEIYNRWSYGFEYKEWFMGAWDIPVTSYTWEHFILQRNGRPEIYKDHTQKETQEVVLKIAKIIDNMRKKD